MNRSNRVFPFVALALVMVTVGGSVVQAVKTGFPNRPLRYIVAFPPGGASDIVARIAGAALTETLGQQVIIDNRSGASGTIGAEAAAHATADGYTLFGCNIASLAVSPALYGVTSTSRDPDLPDVPTIAESGMPGGDHGDLVQGMLALW